MMQVATGMNPLEAYHALIQFARQRGEGALRLALHAAVPQSFRPYVLHLLRVNFVPEAAHDPAVEADVLLAPFCEDLGGGYFQFDAEVQRLLLDELVATYASETTPRVQQVAQFLLAYVERRSRTFREQQDRVAKDYWEMQRWVALAFLAPGTAAEQLAAALQQATAPQESVVHVQLGGLVTCLSIPLAQYPQLLTYAAGVQAIVDGQAEHGRELLARLPDERIKIGRVTLLSPRKLARDWVGRGKEEEDIAAEAVSSPPPPLLTPTFRNSIGMEFVLIRAGEFRMGSENGDGDEKPVHLVRITKPFYLGKYQVTQGQWEAVMGTNPSRFTGDPQRPVEQVSWEDTQEFLRKLREKEGKPYRLPTEAEWEYAARAGATGMYCFGDDERQLPDYAWYDANAKGTTHPVGQLQPNAWGLYDVHGNVWEWGQDWFDGSYYQKSPTDNPQGPERGRYRVVRGGSWYDAAPYLRVSHRNYFLGPGYRFDHLGFRCAV